MQKSKRLEKQMERLVSNDIGKVIEVQKVQNFDLNLVGGQKTTTTINSE